METRSSPRVVSSKKKIQYRSSSWRVQEFEVWSRGEAVCGAVAVRLRDSLVVWVGAAGGAPRLGAVALAVPTRGQSSALSTALLGAEPEAVGLARRLAAATARPALVCCGAHFDRFTLPLVERGLVAEIKGRPDVFDA